MSVDLPYLVALGGPAGVGKTTLAKRLEKERAYKRRRFAGPLKSMLQAMGLTERDVDGPGKDEPNELLLGATPRLAMQTLGTEWGRTLIHPDLWAHLAVEDARRLLNGGGAFGVVLDDLRFENEAEHVRAAHGVVVDILGESEIEMIGAQGQHISEARDYEADVTISRDEARLPLDDIARLIRNRIHEGA